MDKRRIENLSKGILLFSLTIGISYLSLMKLFDPDVWFQLTVGRDILTHKRIPFLDPYSFTTPDHFYTMHEWLYQLILYILNSYIGLNGITIFQVAVILITYLLLFKSISLRSKYTYINIAILFLCLIMSRFRFNHRPEIISFLFLSLFLYFLYKFYYEKKNYLYLMPPVMILWANIHAGAIYGLLLIGMFFLEEVLKTIFKKNKNLFDTDSDKLKTISIVFFATAFSIFLNPNTYNFFLFPFKLFLFNKVSNIKYEELMNSFSMRFLPFWIFFLIFSLSILLTLKRARVRDILLVIPFGFLAVVTARSIPLFGIIVAPFLAENISVIISSFSQRNIEFLKLFPRYKPSMGKTIGNIFVSLIILLICLWTFLFKPPHFFGLGIAEEKIPIGAVRFLKKNRFKGNVFNTHHFGGYILWEGYSDFKIFARADLFDERIFREYTRVILGQIDCWDILNKYRTDFILVDQSPDERGNIRDLLFRNQEWGLIYWDDASLLYGRVSQENRTWMEQNSLRIINPDDNRIVNTSLREEGVLEAAVRELELSVRNAPGSWKAHFYLGGLYRVQGRVDQAIHELKRAIELNSYSDEDANLHLNLGLCYLQKGLASEAVKEFQKELRIQPGSRDIRNLLDIAEKNMKVSGDR